MFSDKRFIVYVYALKTSCLCPYKESEISQSDRSDFRVPQISYSAQINKARVQPRIKGEFVLLVSM